MSDSATSLRASKRVETARRIMRAANELTLAHGLDGWTMDDLAEASDVSRRTLFNYYPAKLDAVLGPMPTLEGEAIETFLAQGPTGELLEDCRVLAHRILDEEQYDRSQLELHRAVIVANPRLLLEVHGRFEQVTASLVGHILQREGESFGADRAVILVRLMVALFDCSLGSLVPGAEAPAAPDRPLTELFDAALDTARELFA